MTVTRPVTAAAIGNGPARRAFGEYTPAPSDGNLTLCGESSTMGWERCGGLAHVRESRLYNSHGMK
ncbi:MAG: hypothetical protein PVH50_09030 [Anaerolineae bacterium]